MPNLNLKFRDISGQKFGLLTALKRVGNKIYSNKKYAIWLFRCDCGNQIERIAKDIRKSKRASCGCFGLEDLTGLKFNMLTATKRIDNTSYLFQCECGNEKQLLYYDVVNGRRQSCGCLLSDGDRKHNKNKRYYIKNFTGKRFHWLTVIKIADTHNLKTNCTVWDCVCICGNSKQVPTNRLKLVKSCGCWATSDLNPKYKQGRFVEKKEGYAKVYIRDRNDDRYGKFVREHHLVMEKKLGRRLLPNENVHHKNGIRDDNRIENLELWVKPQTPGQRAEDLVSFAREILKTYGELFPVK